MPGGLQINELNKNEHVEWGLLKEIASTTGTVEARKLYHGTENFRLRAKLMIVTNFPVNCSEPDDSITRRLKPFRFTHKFEGKEKKNRMSSEIEKELEGVLAWIIQGAIRYYKDGLDTDPDFI